MGAKESRGFDITLPPPKVLKPNEGLAKGVEIQLEDLDGSQAAGGLLSYKGNQVLVYIPDQGNSLASVLKNPVSGKKFHVSHCSTLTSMQTQNRNHRYVATNDTSGMFDLTDWTGSEKARGALTVCRNCLKYVNYQDYRGRSSEQTKIFRSFSLIEFFSTYSSLFKHPYTRSKRVSRNTSLAVSETHGEWSTSQAAMACSNCAVTLPKHFNALSPDGGEQSTSAARLCVDCDRRKNWHDAEPVLIDDMRAITRQRRKQGLLNDIGTWKEAYELADPAFHGLMKIYERQGRSVPEIGHPLTDDNGMVLEPELALAWELQRSGVVATEAEQAQYEANEWVVLTLAQALMESQEDH